MRDGESECGVGARARSGDGELMPKPDEARSDRPACGNRDEVLDELEAAWAPWLRGNPSDDARIVSLLRAAFAAGYEAGHDDVQRAR